MFVCVHVCVSLCLIVCVCVFVCVSLCLIMCACGYNDKDHGLGCLINVSIFAIEKLIAKESSS